MRLKILPRRLFVLLSLFSLGFASFGLAQTQQAPIACAQTTYGLNQCEIVNSPSDCPFATVAQDIAAGATKGSYCYNRANRFCEILTNSSVSVIGGGVDSNTNFLFCEDVPSTSVGKCNGTNFEWVLNNSHPTRREIEVYLDQFRGLLDNENSPSRIECNNLYSQGVNKVVIPKLKPHIYELFESDDYTGIASQMGITPRAANGSYLYSDLLRMIQRKLELLKVASDIGFTIQNTGSRDRVFCGNNSIYFSDYEKDGTKFEDVCVEIPRSDALGKNSCYMAVAIPASPVAGAAITTQQACLGRKDDALYFHNTSSSNFNNTYRSNLLNLNITTNPNVDLLTCRNTSFNVLNERSNRGCSPYIAVGRDATVASSEKWRQCARCLYGENAFVTNEQCVNYGGTDRNTCPAGPGNTSLIGATLADDRPDLEPLLEPIPGQLFNDLGGCLNTSSTASIVNTLIRIALGLMGAIVIFRIIQGAITMQSGDPESFEEGRAVITSAIMGLLVLILSAAILNFLAVNVLQLNPESGFVPFGG